MASGRRHWPCSGVRGRAGEEAARARVEVANKRVIMYGMALR